jgi:UDP-N-acetylglucosamine pyrophosphorylase
MLKADKLYELCTNAENLSYLYHKEFKRQPYWDFKTMRQVRPPLNQKNAYKFELKLEDFLPFIEGDKLGILKVDREDEFAPVIYADNQASNSTPTKNGDKYHQNDRQDTPSWARDLIFKQSVRWLKQAGALIENDDDLAQIEVDTLFSYDGEGLKQYVEGKKFPPPHFIKKSLFK